jgi:hypothetical protein
MKKTVHYDPQIVKDYEDKRKMLRDAQDMALKMMENDSIPTQDMDDSISRDRLLKIAKQKKAIGGDDSVVRDQELKSVTPGNRKYISSEWEKTHEEADDIRQEMGDYTLDGKPNLKASDKTSKLYRSASKRLDPLSKELGMQQQFADNENDLKMRIKQEALRRILSGISE